MNSFQKKAIFLSILIAFVVTLWKKDQHEYIKTKQEVSWIHYKKDDNGKLVQNFISDSEFKNNGLEQNIDLTQNNRRPSSTSDQSSMKETKKDDVKQAQKVVFLNQSNPNAKPELNELNFVNSYNPEWKELLAKELMMFQPKSIEVYFKPQKSVVKILENNQAIFLEEVAVTFKTNMGPRSFKALINSENGKIVETWGRTHYDNFSPRLPASENKGLRADGTL